MCVFLRSADSGGCHRRRGREEGRKPFLLPPVSGLISRQRVASGGGAWEPRAATVLAVPEVFTALFQRLRGFQHCPGLFWVIFVILELFNVMFLFSVEFLWIFVFCILYFVNIGVKEKKRNKNSESVCVSLYLFFMNVFFYYFYF